MQNKTPSLFTSLALLGILAILVGFLNTFIIPLVSGTKTWPLSIYLHGAFVFGWVILFLLQSVFIQQKKHKAHFSLGRLGTFIAIGAAISILPAALYQCERELKEGLGEIAISAIVGSVSSALMFLTFVSLGIYFRKKPAIHKRFLLLATIVLIWPAWFRWRHYFPSVARPEIWFSVVLADSLILVAFIWDWFRHQRIHPALLFGGLFIITENILEIFFFDSAPWRTIAHFIYDILT